MSSTATYPAMLKRPPAGALLPLLLIFICGCTVGALAMSLFHHRNTAREEAINKLTVLDWKKQLNLTEAQQRELETTLDDLHRYYVNVVADGKDRIMEILNDDQKIQFERMMKEKHKL